MRLPLVVSGLWLALSLVLALTGCSDDPGPTRFGYGLVRPDCGLAGGNAVAVRLSEQPVSCDTLEDRPGVWIFASPATVEPQRFEPPSTGISHCEGDVCEALEGYLEITEVESDQVSLEWSLGFDDGSVDEGSMQVMRCPQVAPGCD